MATEQHDSESTPSIAQDILRNDFMSSSQGPAAQMSADEAMETLPERPRSRTLADAFFFSALQHTPARVNRRPSYRLSDFEAHRTLGVGSFGRVYLGQSSF